MYAILVRRILLVRSASERALSCSESVKCLSSLKRYDSDLNFFRCGIASSCFSFLPYNSLNKKERKETTVLPVYKNQSSMNCEFCGVSNRVCEKELLRICNDRAISCYSLLLFLFWWKFPCRVFVQKLDLSYKFTAEELDKRESLLYTRGSVVQQIQKLSRYG